MSELLFRFAAFELDEANARLRHDDGRNIDLPPRAFAVLCELARRSGRLVTKNELLDTVWGHRHVSESVLKSTISVIRIALGDDSRNPRFIETVSRKGYRMVAEPAAVTTPPGSAPAAPPRPLLVGRGELLARLDGAWRAARTGERRLCWIVGEAGAGKTTLLDHFGQSVSGARIARGQCVEQHGAGEPYLPLLEALSALCERDQSLRLLLRQVAPTWLMQMPWLLDDAERLSLRQALVGASQERMLRELGELLDRYTQNEPLVLITEDLHWSDEATIRAMNHVARRRSPARLLWLASFRLADVASDSHPLHLVRHELRAHRLIEELVVDPFSEQEVAEYLQRRVPDVALPERAIQSLYASTDGLPLYLSHVVDEFLRVAPADAITNASQGELLLSTVMVPESATQAIEVQIARLEREPVRILEAAAVVGLEFLPSVVAGVLGLTTGAVADICEQLARQRRWLKAVGVVRLASGELDAKYAFTHSLHRHVFYRRMSELARATHHRRAAGLLAHIQASAAEIALHYELGHEPALALTHYLAAIEHALRSLAPSDAVRLSEQAIAVFERQDPAVRSTDQEITLYALRGAGSAQALGVSSNAAKLAFARAQTLLCRHFEHPLRSLILHGYGLVLFVRGEYGEAKATAARSLELAERYDDGILRVAACDLLGQLHTIQGFPEAGLSYLLSGLSAAEAVGDEALSQAYVVDPIVTMTAVLALPLLHLGRVVEARQQLEKAHARASALKQPMAMMVALWFSALFEVRRDNVERVAAIAAQLRAVVDDYGVPQGIGPANWYAGWAAARLGEPERGIGLIRQGYENNLVLEMHAGNTEVLGYAAEALLQAGDWRGALDALDEAFQLAEALPERAYTPKLHLLRSDALAGAGDMAGAEGALADALAAAREQQAAWLEVQVLVETCRRRGPSVERKAELARAFARLDTTDDSPVVSAARAFLAA